MEITMQQESRMDDLTMVRMIQQLRNDANEEAADLLCDYSTTLAENAALREIVSACALYAGGTASPKCSTAFMREVPKEVALLAKRAEAMAAALREAGAYLADMRSIDCYNNAANVDGDPFACANLANRIDALLPPPTG